MKTCLIFICAFIQANALFFGERRLESHADVSQTCLNQAAWGKCEFYQCLEDRFPCGSDGFALKVGKHFCNKADRVFNNFNEMGRRWMNGTSRCLTNRLLPIYNSYATRCGDIKDAGASAIIECNGREEADGTNFCGFVQQNSDVYTGLFGAEDIGRILSMRKPMLVANLIGDASRCGARSLGSRLQAATRAVGAFFQSVASSITSLFD